MVVAWVLVVGVAVAVMVLVLAVAALVLRMVCHSRAAATEVSRALEGKETIAFFHPYAHAGGGGERVLWCAIHAIQQRHPGVHCVVYTGDSEVTKGQFLDLARERFGVRVAPGTVHFAFLSKRRWVEAETWPRFTLFGQSLGSIVLGWEALCCICPDVVVDSMGYAFTLPLFALVGGCRVGCYVHYPTISTDMLSQVRSRSVGVCNDETVARSQVLSLAKLLYYRVFAAAYGFVGRYAEVVMVNSSWTRGHVDALWRIPERTSVVFPPCDTEKLAALPLERASAPHGGGLAVSLAQFRPEKNHALQLRAFARFLELAPERRKPGPERVRLALAGGCRDAGDRSRVEALQALCMELGLREKGGDRDEDWDVVFRTNISVDEMQSLLGQATVGLHTMKEEHFGINVVEFMAAGAVPLAHRSGGPLMDIVTPLDGQRTGLLAEDEESYAAALQEIFSLAEDERRTIAAAAREAVRSRFAQEAFEVAVADRMVAPLRRSSAS